MSVSMQGTWTVTVRSRNAAFNQRFVIHGSTNGKDGPHAGAPGTSVVVAGPQWSLAVENDHGSGAWSPSKERIGTPSIAGGLLSFDIRTDDGGGGGDRDYDDLVLACSLVPSDAEFVLYGRVRSYAGLCRLNPCFPLPYLVVDAPGVMARALADGRLRAALEALYPERVRRFDKRRRHPPGPPPGPDPEPFRPMMIPLAAAEGSSVLAAAKARAAAAPERAAAPENALAAFAAPAASGPRSTLGSAALADYAVSVLDLARLKDVLRPVCTTQARPGLLLRFQEYDRTAAELAGGAYAGNGARQTLGLAVTDELGHYIFRFTRTLPDLSQETDDIPAGSSMLAGLRPDIVVQVVASIGPTPTVLYETGLFGDVANLRRIDLCIPDEVLHVGTDACRGTRAIQSIGNIFTIAGMGNTLDADGRITATHPSGPQITRGGWAGSLHLFACFLGRPQVRTYTIRYRKPGGGWAFVQEAYTHINKAAIGDPASPLHKVGPYPAALKVDGGPAVTVPAYNNIEADPNWIETHRLRKAILGSALYAAALYPGQVHGSVDFRIEGFDAAGNEVPGAEDTIRLFIDNRPMTGDIARISKAGAAPGECALFTLDSPGEAITVRFKVEHPGGFLQRWSLDVYRGSATPVPVADGTAPVEPLAVNYSEAVHGNTFFGTADGVAPDGEGYVSVDLQPTAGAWLPAGKTFCAFSFEVSGDPRITDGYSDRIGGRLDFELVGISL